MTKPLAIFAVLAWSFGASLRSAEPPNFLIIAIDDLNDYVGCLGGHPNASTPNLDRLAKRGVLFTRAYCNSPVCNPSRAAIWTGLRPTTTGIHSNPSGWFRNRPKFKKTLTLPQALAAHGYSTTAFGKLFHPGRGNSSMGEWQRFEAFQYGPKQEPKLNYPARRLEGVSLRPLLENPQAIWDRPALTTFVDHHALRTSTHRYIRYADGAEELYDHREDPHEWENLAVTRPSDTAVQAILRQSRQQLDALLEPTQ